MMPCKYITIDNKESVFDLDNVIDVIRGPAPTRKGWTALIVYDPKSEKFIELRDSPPDIKGNSKDEAEEVTLEYLYREFNLNKDTLILIKNNPKRWEFIEF